jgi:hypothetical protein
MYVDSFRIKTLKTKKKKKKKDHRGNGWLSMLLAAQPLRGI